MSYRDEQKSSAILLFILLGIGAATVIGGLMFGMPQYSVYAARLEGESELAKATYSKQVAVSAAQNKLDAAKLEAETDKTRAIGLAAANKTLADGLGGPEGYLKWAYIEALKEVAQHNGTQVIYIPTEAGSPILEAGKRPVTK